MSLMGDILKALKDVVLMNDRITHLTETSKALVKENRDLHDRLVRVEVFIEMASARGVPSQRALPPTVQG